MTARSALRSGPRPLGSLIASIVTAVLLTGCTAGQAATPDPTPAVLETQTEVTANSSEQGTETEAAVSLPAEAEPDDAGESAPLPGEAEPEDANDASESAPLPGEAEPDYANDAGKDLQVHEYPDDPEPAVSVVATLCNLNRDYIASLRTTADGVPVVDDNLRTMLVALSDYLSHWDTLRPHYPETVPHIDTAQQVYDLWDQALLDRENGDPDAAQSAMLSAEKFLDQLPTGELSDCKTE